MECCNVQANFVAQLYKTGMIDEGEEDMLDEVIDKQVRRLTRQGAEWRIPLVVEVFPGI